MIYSKFFTWGKLRWSFHWAKSQYEIWTVAKIEIRYKSTPDYRHVEFELVVRPRKIMLWFTW